MNAHSLVGSHLGKRGCAANDAHPGRGTELVAGLVKALTPNRVDEERHSMTKVDLRKDLKHLYNPSAKAVALVDVPPMNFLMLDGSGDPNTSPAYVAAIEALFALSYALKFRVKTSQAGVDYAVMPLEGLWWVDDPRQFSMQDKGNFQWTAMIMQPPYVTAALVAEMLAETQKRKGLAALEKIRFTSYAEGLSVQIMHIGPYAAEEPTIARLHRFIAESGYTLRGKHHEIYLNDVHKTAPEKLQTVVRQPVEKAGAA